jgi:hypothetical protein
MLHAKVLTPITIGCMQNKPMIDFDKVVLKIPVRNAGLLEQTQSSKPLGCRYIHCLSHHHFCNECDRTADFLSCQPKPSDFMAAMTTMTRLPTIIVYSTTRVVDLLSRTCLSVLMVTPLQLRGAVVNRSEQSSTEFPSLGTSRSGTRAAQPAREVPTTPFRSCRE